MQSLKCFEKVNNYDIEYKLQSRMLYHQVTSYYAGEKISTFHIMSEVAMTSSAMDFLIYGRNFYI